MNLGLEGCRAIVAAASKGIGKACAETLADEGARVFIFARTAKDTERAAAEIGAAGWSTADVSRAEDATRVIEEGVSALGGLDILITNAGGPPTGRFEDAGDNDWDIGYRLTLMSAVRLIRAALPELKKSKRGRIVNLTGFGVKEPPSDLCVSDSVRAAVTVMAKTLANDLAPYGITVNNVAPGPIRTDRLVELFAARAAAAGITLQEQFDRFVQTVPVRRIGEPEEVAGICAYLCSVQAGYITGQSIVIDGGINRSI